MHRDASSRVVTTRFRCDVMRIDATAMNAGVSTATCSINGVAEMIQNKISRNRSIFPFVGKNMSGNLKASLNPKLAIALHEMVGPEVASRSLVEFPLAIETFARCAASLVSNGLGHQGTTIFGSLTVRLAITSRFIGPLAPEESAEVWSRMKQVLGHGIKTIRLETGR
jgi:hypothetical protein